MHIQFFLKIDWKKLWVKVMHILEDVVKKYHLKSYAEEISSNNYVK